MRANHDRALLHMGFLSGLLSDCIDEELAQLVVDLQRMAGEEQLAGTSNTFHGYRMVVVAEQERRREAKARLQQMQNERQH